MIRFNNFDLMVQQPPFHIEQAEPTAMRSLWIRGGGIRVNIRTLESKWNIELVSQHHLKLYWSVQSRHRSSLTPKLAQRVGDAPHDSG